MRGAGGRGGTLTDLQKSSRCELARRATTAVVWKSWPDKEEEEENRAEVEVPRDSKKRSFQRKKRKTARATSKACGMVEVGNVVVIKKVEFPPSADVLGIMPTELHASARGKDFELEGVKREREENSTVGAVVVVRGKVPRLDESRITKAAKYSPAILENKYMRIYVARCIRASNLWEAKEEVNGGGVKRRRLNDKGMISIVYARRANVGELARYYYTLNRERYPVVLRDTLLDEDEDEDENDEDDEDDEDDGLRETEIFKSRC
ncbi:hypothetical protein M0802_000372 [Mischocyttarus mexicanus]|nr:hypothetical protein M0802_000372 [Mischocyttarus mexicanus]